MDIRAWMVGAWLLVAGGVGVTAAQAPGADPERQAALQRLVEERFALRVQERLGLTPEQTERLRAVAGEYGARRRTLEAEERLVRRLLAEQLRPGATPDETEVARLQERLLEVRERYLQTFRDEQARLEFLTPVQRAQFLGMREQFARRVQELREQRQERLRDRQPPRGPAALPRGAPSR